MGAQPEHAQAATRNARIAHGRSAPARAGDARPGWLRAAARLERGGRGAPASVTQGSEPVVGLNTRCGEAPRPQRKSDPMQGATQPGTAGTRDALPTLLFVITFTTGLIDAVSIIGLGNVFVASMTG